MQNKVLELVSQGIELKEIQKKLNLSNLELKRYSTNIDYFNTKKEYVIRKYQQDPNYVPLDYTFGSNVTFKNVYDLILSGSSKEEVCKKLNINIKYLDLMLTMRCKYKEPLALELRSYLIIKKIDDSILKLKTKGITYSINNPDNKLNNNWILSFLPLNNIIELDRCDSIFEIICNDILSGSSVKEISKIYKLHIDLIMYKISFELKNNNNLAVKVFNYLKKNKCDLPNKNDLNYLKNKIFINLYRCKNKKETLQNIINITGNNNIKYVCGDILKELTNE